MAKKTEQIAREATERLVTAGELSRYGYQWDWVFMDGVPLFEPEGQQSVEDVVANMRSLCATVILAAIEEDRQQPPPVESPVSAERLEEIHGFFATPPFNVPHAALTRADALFDHIAHLERLVRWLMQSPEGDDVKALLTQARQAGYEEGKRDGRSSDSWGHWIYDALGVRRVR